MAGRYDTPVNYFAHGLRFLNRPHFLAGTAVPDWLSVKGGQFETEVMAMPRRDHVPHPIQEQLIIELTSK